jgi:hypothetical protein
MSRTLSMNCGSGESLNVSLWWGLSANARQIRLTAVTHPGRLSHRARRPVRRVRRLLLERLDDHPLDITVADRTRLTRTRLIMQPIKTTPREPATPLADRRGRAPQSRSDLLAGLPLGSGQHDPAAQRQRLSALRTPSPTLEHLPLGLIEHDLSTRRHNGLQSSLITTNFATKPPLPAN